jgi:hypothetical protein
LKSWTKWTLLAFLLCILPLPAGAATSQTKGTGEWNPKPAERWLEVVKKERRLYLRQGEKVLKTFRVAIGSGKGTKKSPIDKVTPVGVFTIRRIADPTNWIFDPKVFNEPGEPQKDVYGKWAISFRNPWNLAIHGTNAPWSIGKAVTHGCIRLKNSDIEELVKHVKPGMKLVIREKPPMPPKSQETETTSARTLPAQETETFTVSPPAEPTASPIQPLPEVEGSAQSQDLGSPVHPASQDVDGNKSQDVGYPAVPSDQQAPPKDETAP